MCLTLLQPRVKQSGTPVFKQPIVPPGLLIHFYHWLSPYTDTVRQRFPEPKSGSSDKLSPLLYTDIIT